MDVRPIVLDFRSRMTLSFSSSFEVFVVPTESHNDGGRDTRGFNVVVHSAGKYLSCPRDTLHAQRVLQGYCLSSNSPAFLSSGPTGPRTAAITRLSILLATKAPIDDSAPFEEAAILSHPAQIILSSPPPPFLTLVNSSSVKEEARCSDVGIIEQGKHRRFIARCANGQQERRYSLFRAYRRAHLLSGARACARGWTRVGDRRGTGYGWCMPYGQKGQLLIGSRAHHLY
ncbi:hypothetical protein HN011_009960 [Eciton burchellii]|nr:hypothetical protein HN011_009960 [Eciton burchellii]